jgi:hypothetical protein
LYTSDPLFQVIANSNLAMTQCSALMVQYLVVGKELFLSEVNSSVSHSSPRVPGLGCRINKKRNYQDGCVVQGSSGPAPVEETLLQEEEIDFL